MRVSLGRRTLQISGNKQKSGFYNVDEKGSKETTWELNLEGRVGSEAGWEEEGLRGRKSKPRKEMEIGSQVLWGSSQAPQTLGAGNTHSANTGPECGGRGGKLTRAPSHCPCQSLPLSSTWFYPTELQINTSASLLIQTIKGQQTFEENGKDKEEKQTSKRKNIKRYFWDNVENVNRLE